MQALVRNRQIVAPGLGAAVLLAAMLGLGMGPTLAIVLGALVWAGAALVLGPERPFARLFGRDTGIPAEDLERELSAAGERIAAITRHARALGGGIGSGLAGLAEAAQGILDDLANRSPGQIVQARQVLVHKLDNVASIAERLVYLRSVRADTSTFEARAERVIRELEPVFRRRQALMLADETMDIDARLTLLEEEVKADAGARGLRIPPGTKQRSSETPS